MPFYLLVKVLLICWNKRSINNTYKIVTFRSHNILSERSQMIILIVIFLLIFLMAGCHCPTPIGFCAHDVQYLLLGVPFLWPLRMKIQNFHWWKHKKCPHHISEKCKGHDHVVPTTKCGQEGTDGMNQYWEKERSKIS